MSSINHSQFYLQLQDLDPSERLPAFKKYLAAMADPVERNKTARFLIAKPVADQKVVFVLIHGIRTNAPWQQTLKQILEVENGVKTFTCKYGWTQLMYCLIPYFRKTPIDLVQRHLNDVRKLHPDAKLTVIAHSFGTYILSCLLPANSIAVDRLLLCGSVVKQSYDWTSNHANAHYNNIINDVGINDLVPLLANASSFDFGLSGTFGFGTPCVTDRFHLIGHSDFFTESHMRHFWVPFLTKGQVVPSMQNTDQHPSGAFAKFLSKMPNGTFIYFLRAAIFAIILFSISIIFLKF